MIGKFVTETKEPVATLGSSLCWLALNCTLNGPIYLSVWVFLTA